MQFVIQDIIDRARVYLDDDHKEDDGWIDPDKWLTLFNIEYRDLYRKWVRMALVRPYPTTTSLTNGSVTIAGVLAICGVGEDMGSYVRWLTPAQVRGGPDPFWFGSSTPHSKAIEWAAHGAADNMLVEVGPQDLSTTYLVRWIPTVLDFTDPTQVVDLPYGGDERLVVGLARRALVKESARSSGLEKLMADADAEMTFTALSRGGGVRVRRVGLGRATLPDRFSSFPTDQRFWQYA